MLFGSLNFAPEIKGVSMSLCHSYKHLKVKNWINKIIIYEEKILMEVIKYSINNSENAHIMMFITRVAKSR